MNLEIILFKGIVLAYHIFYDLCIFYGKFLLNRPSGSIYLILIERSTLRIDSIKDFR